MTNIPKTMTAFVLEGHGEMDKLVWHTDWPTPEPNENEVLIKVEACGLNNTDVNTRSGWYSKSVTEATTGGTYSKVGDDDPTWGGAPVSFPRIQGADAVGRVVAVGANAQASLMNQRVLVDGWLRDWSQPNGLKVKGYYGSEADGGFAEYTVRDYREVLPINSPLSSAELATFSCSYTTAENMLNRAHVGEGDTVLIPGASGGVGGALIQLANRRGAVTIAMASEAKHDKVGRLNPNYLLPRAPSNLKAAIKAVTGSEEVDVVADVVGGPLFPAFIDSLAPGGRYTCSGAIAGPMVDLDLRTLYLRDLSFTGNTITTLDVFPDLIRYIENGEIKPALAATFPLAELHTAQQKFIDKQHVGNIVVTMD